MKPVKRWVLCVYGARRLLACNAGMGSCAEINRSKLVRCHLTTNRAALDY